MQYSLMTMFGLEYARKSDQEMSQVVSIFKLASMAYFILFRVYSTSLTTSFKKWNVMMTWYGTFRAIGNVYQVSVQQYS